MKPGRELDALVAEKVMGLSVWRKPNLAEFEDSGRRGLIGVPSVLMGHSAQQINDMFHTADLLAEGDSYRVGAEDSTQLVPHYSTDIAAAWEVVERSRKTHSFTVSSEWEHSWHCEVKWHLEDNTQGDSWAQADAAPHAICLAALKAVGAL